MSTVYDQNAPTAFPSPQAQPDPAGEKIEGPGGVGQLVQIRETVERWKKEILDRIQYLRENLDQAQQDREALSLEADQLKKELGAARSRIEQLEGDLTGVLGLYNTLIQEVNGALQE
jgi:predicted nuclease with TOPRIM domain